MDTVCRGELNLIFSYLLDGLVIMSENTNKKYVLSSVNLKTKAN